MGNVLILFRLFVSCQLSSWRLSTALRLSVGQWHRSRTGTKLVALLVLPRREGSTLVTFLAVFFRPSVAGPAEATSRCASPRTGVGPEGQRRQTKPRKGVPHVSYLPLEGRLARCKPSRWGVPPAAPDQSSFPPVLYRTDRLWVRRKGGAYASRLPRSSTYRSTARRSISASSSLLCRLCKSQFANIMQMNANGITSHANCMNVESDW